MNAFLSRILLFLFTCSFTFGISQSFNHPGVSLTTQDINFIKARLDEGAEPWASAYQQLRSSKFANLNYKPQAIESVRCGYYNAGAVGCREQSDDAIAAFTHAIIWVLKDDQRHADKAIEILNNWRRNHKRNEGDNTPLQVGWVAPGFVDAAELLRYTYSGWKNSDIEAFEDYVKDVYLTAMGHDPWPANWMFSVLQARLAISVFVNDRNTFNKARDTWRKRIVNMIYQETDGPEPVRYGNERNNTMDKYWFGAWDRDLFVDGFSQETCRDMGHLYLGTKGVSYSGQILFNQGVDVFNEEKERLTDFMEFHSKLINGTPFNANSICKEPIMRNNDDVHRSGDRLRQHVELMYYHLNDRLKMNLPETKKVVDYSRPAAASRWFAQWETLLYVRDERLVTPNRPPEGAFVQPTTDMIEEGYPQLYVLVDATDPDGDDISLTLFLDGEEVRRESKAPYEWGHSITGNDFTEETRGLTPGNHVLKVIIKDSKNAETTITKNILVTTITGLSRFEESSISVYPNPSASGLFELSKVSNWRVYNLQGALISSGIDKSVDLSIFGSGVYTLKIDNQVKRLIVK